MSKKKVIVFQHVANRILGTLNPMLKSAQLRIRYINFERTPELTPEIEKYEALIIMGGNMGVYESHTYPHIKTELKLIEQAMKKNIPILGICLGSQLIAEVLGAKVRKAQVKEMGWSKIKLTEFGKEDILFKHFKSQEYLFQMHGDTFDIPKSAIHLATSDVIPSQAFKYNDNVYALQFHLEVDEATIARWLKNPLNQKDFNLAEQILMDNQKFLPNSLEISKNFFFKFCELLESKPELNLAHGKMPNIL